MALHDRADATVRMIDYLLRNGEIADYDDEIANRLDDARSMARVFPDLLSYVRRCASNCAEANELLKRAEGAQP